MHAQENPLFGGVNRLYLADIQLGIFYLQSWPKTMWTVAFHQLFKLKCKIYRFFFNPPVPLNNVVF